MSKVDFYVIDAVGYESRQRFACRLAEKAYRLNHTVHIHVGDKETLRHLDELLWTFRDGSFVPHEIIEAPLADIPAPITISCDHMPSRDCDLLINLSEDIPDKADAFPRVAEIVTADDDIRARGRQRFVDYRERGHTLDTHKL